MANTTIDSLRLKEINLQNFRAFQRLRIEFDEHLTVFIGDNAMGKTTILDAIAGVLIQLTNEMYFSDKNSKQIPSFVKTKDIKNDTANTLVTAEFEFSIDLDNQLTDNITNAENTLFEDEAELLTHLINRITDTGNLHETEKAFLNNIKSLLNNFIETKAADDSNEKQQVLESTESVINDFDKTVDNDDFNYLITEISDWVRRAKEDKAGQNVPKISSTIQRGFEANIYDKNIKYRKKSESLEEYYSEKLLKNSTNAEKEINHIFVYYGYTVSDAEAKLTHQPLPQNKAAIIFNKALNPYRFSLNTLMDWLNKIYKQYLTGNEEAIALYKFVRKTVLDLLNAGTDYEVYRDIKFIYNDDGDQLIFIKTYREGNDIEVSYNQLSSGEKNLFGIIADLAMRVCVANPQNPEKVKGIVLIDEIDLHLHPKWQRTVLPALIAAFKEFQFVVTTHSPFVIQSVVSEKIKEKPSIRSLTLYNLEELTVKELKENVHSNNAVVREIFGLEHKFSQQIQYELNSLKYLANDIKKKGNYTDEFLNKAKQIALFDEELKIIVKQIISDIEFYWNEKNNQNK